MSYSPARDWLKNLATPPPAFPVLAISPGRDWAQKSSHWLARISLSNSRPQAERLIPCPASTIGAACAICLSACRAQSRPNGVPTVIGETNPFGHPSLNLPPTRITGCQPSNLIDADPARKQYLCQFCQFALAKYFHCITSSHSAKISKDGYCRAILIVAQWDISRKRIWCP